MIRIARPSAIAAATSLFVVLGVAWGGFLGARHIAALGSALDRLENVALDWRYAFAGFQAAPRGVVIAAIDDATLAQAGSFPLPRAMLARIIRGLAAHNPQVIALDMLLIDAGTADADLELVEALRSTKTVIGAAALFDANTASPQEESFSSLDRADFLPHPTQILWPQEQFRSVARSALTNVSTDQSGVPRYMPMLFDLNGAIVPSLALATTAAALNTDPALGSDSLRLGARSVAMDLGYHMPLRFYGPRGSIRTISASRALNGELDPDDVRGEVVVVGSTAAATGDGFATPFDRVTPGVEVLATAISNLLAGDALIKDGRIRRIDASVAIVLPITIVLLLAIRRISIALMLIVLTLGGWIVLTCIAFSQGYWLSIALPLAASVPIAIAYGLTRLWIEQRASKRFASEGNALRRFQAPHLLDILARDPQFLTTPVHQNAAIIFMDLSGFTGVTESLGPAWTRELLATLHECIETTVVRQRGLVVSYMGDGAMIVFGLPSPKGDDASRALRAAAGLHESLSNWLANLPPVARDRLTSRVGAHFGPVILSRLGAATHQHIAATGDTVNVASRLLEVAKERHARIVLSEDLYRAAAHAPEEATEYESHTVIEVSIRGREHPILVRVWGEDAHGPTPVDSTQM
jgi:adenylate cyclase